MLNMPDEFEEVNPKNCTNSLMPEKWINTTLFCQPCSLRYFKNECWTQDEQHGKQANTRESFLWGLFLAVI